MPLKLLRGSVDCPRAPKIDGSDGENGLLTAYLTYFGREARWPGFRACATLFGLDAGFTAETSLRVAVRAASIYLASHEADITLYVPEDAGPGPQAASELAEYIAWRYTGPGGQMPLPGSALFGQVYDRAAPPVPHAPHFASAPQSVRPDRGRKRGKSVRRGADAPSTFDALSVSSLPKEGPPSLSLEELLDKTDAGFSETLLRLIDQSGRRDAEVYKAANIDRKLFSKIRSNPRYRPSKATALALAFALRLDLDGTRDLIGRAGYTLTHASRADIIVEYYIVTGNYDIFALNETLFRYDLPLLGGA